MGLAYCVKAVAIRSGKSHYIFDRSNHTILRDSYLDCDENDLHFNKSGSTKIVSEKNEINSLLIFGNIPFHLAIIVLII